MFRCHDPYKHMTFTKIWTKTTTAIRHCFLPDVSMLVSTDLADAGGDWDATVFTVTGLDTRGCCILIGCVCVTWPAAGLWVAAADWLMSFVGVACAGEPTGVGSRSMTFFCGSKRKHEIITRFDSRLWGSQKTTSFWTLQRHHAVKSED